MQVRCKMVLVEIRTYSKTRRKFIFDCQYDASIPEDQRFYKASPSGRFEIDVDNPAVDYEVGKAYYFDSNPVSNP